MIHMVDQSDRRSEPEVTRNPQDVLKGWMLIWYLIACTIITGFVAGLAVHGFFTAY